MNIVFFGTSAFGVPTLEALADSSHRLLSTVTTPAKPQGRRLEIQDSPVKKWALGRGLPCLEVSDKKDLTARHEDLKKTGADVFVVISFGVLLPGQTLRIPKRLCLNVHASLLPRWRGASPIQSALLNGDNQTGVSVMRMTETLDAGDILLQKDTPIRPEEDRKSLEERLSRLSAEALLEALTLLESGQAVFSPQEAARVRFCKKIAKDDGRVRWNEPVSAIQNRFRAMAGWPGSFFFYEGKRILVIEAAPADSSAAPAKAPGTVLAASAAEGIVVAARDGSWRISKIQLEGKKPLSAADFLRGSPVGPGRLFE